MLEYGFSLTGIFPYKDRLFDFVLIRENSGQRKPIFWLIYVVYPERTTLLVSHRAGSNEYILTLKKISA